MKANIILPQDIYESHLQIVNEIKFTCREIDIMAYLISGKSAKTIAACLFISPKTIEAHMRNIMMKLECNSRDGIIYFIEKSKKLSLLKEHYLSLLIRASFEEQLLKIADQLDPEQPTCVIVYWRDQEYHSSFIRYLESHLNLAGVTIFIEAREGKIFIKDPVNNTETLKSELIIYAIPEAMIEQVEGVDNKNKRDVTSFIQKIRKTQNSIIALFPSKNIKNDIFQDRGNMACVHNLRRENYYDFTFAVLKRLLPNIALDQIILDFKSHYESICGASDIVHKQLHQEDKTLSGIGLVSQLRVYISNFFNTKNLRKKSFFIGSVLSIAVLCVWFLTFVEKKEGGSAQNKALDYGIAVRDDLSIPTQSVFLDRPYLMERIDKSLKGHHEIQAIALTGMGGAGKTTLARHYTRQQNAKVVWEINAESEDKLINSFENLAEALAITEAEKEKVRGIKDIKNADEREKKIIFFVRDKLKRIPNWILIYDNVEKFKDIQKSFPHDPSVWGRGKVILITRDNNIKNNNNINEAIQIGELSPEDKLALFVKIMTNGNSSKFTATQTEQAKKFLNDIPPFPLDVSIAAYYLKATNVPYGTYLEKLIQYDRDFESVQQSLLEEASYYTKTRYGIITLSLQHIINSHKDFWDLLLFISLLDSQNIPRDLLDKYKTSTVVDNFIYNLKKHSFVTNEVVLPSGSIPAFSIHRSTQAIALAYLTKLQNSEKNKRFIEPIGTAFKNYVGEVIDKEDFAKMSFVIRHCEMFLSHPNLLTDFVIASIGSELGNVYRDLGNYEKAKQLFEESLVIYKKNSYENHPWFAQALGRLGSIYREQCNYEKARQLIEESLVIYRKNSYENNPWFARALAWLGSVYRDQGNYEKAKQLLEESLLIYRKNSHEAQPWFAWTLVWLGNLYREQGNYEKAKQLLEESLVIYKKNSYENHPLFARALVGLGSVYKEQGNYEKAKQLFEESLMVYKKNSYENHPWFARTLEHLGSIYKEMGNYEKAKQSLEESLMIYRWNHFENHPWFALVLAGLGSVYREQGNYEKAKDLLERSFQTYEKTYGKDHIDVAPVIMNLGQVYMLENDIKTAENLIKKALRIFQIKKYAESYVCLEILSDLYLKETFEHINKEDMQQSEIFIKQSLEVIQAHFPEDSPHFIRIKAKLNKLTL